MLGNLGAVMELKRDLENVPAVPIEEAAELLEISLRTMYRRRFRFESLRRKGHLYITVRSLQRFIEQEQYFPTSSFNVTKKHRHLGQD
jgi:hypothetical protein